MSAVAALELQNTHETDVLHKFIVDFIVQFSEQALVEFPSNGTILCLLAVDCPWPSYMLLPSALSAIKSRSVTTTKLMTTRSFTGHVRLNSC